MTDGNPDRLYELLPQLVRARDRENGQPLRALMAVLNGEYLALEEDIQALYDNWFVETCDHWTIPYLADLVGVRDLRDGAYWHPTQRRRVANTIGYRRRKGTAAVLEQAARDATGWACRAVETSRLTARTHDVRRAPRPGRGTADLRDAAALARIGGPFDSLARGAETPTSGLSADARPPHGRPRVVHPRGLALYFWRLRPYPIVLASPGAPRPSRDEPPPHGETAAPCDGQRTFDPLGFDVPLFHRPPPNDSLSHAAVAFDLPVPLRRDLFAADLEHYGRRRRRGSIDADAEHSLYYGPGRSFQILERADDATDDASAAWTTIAARRLLSVDLGRWPDAERRRAWTLRDPEKRIAVDVERGRFVLLHDDDRAAGADRLRVDYCYGCADDLGAGPYIRDAWNHGDAPASRRWTVAEDDPKASLQEALDAWNQCCEEHRLGQASADGAAPIPEPLVGQIRIVDNRTHVLRSPRIDLPPGARLTISAAQGLRPAVRMEGPLEVECDLAFGEFRTREHGSGEPLGARRLELDGLLIDGSIRVAPFSRETTTLALRSCTMAPDANRPSVATSAGALQLTVERCMLGGLRLAASTSLDVQDSVVDSGGAPFTLEAADDGPRAERELKVVDRSAIQRWSAERSATVRLARSTFLGRVALALLPAATNCLFDERSSAVFVSRRFGDPAYAQLAWHNARELLEGAEDNSEPGVFFRLRTPQRLAGLQKIMPEYLPLGADLTCFFVN